MSKTTFLSQPIYGCNLEATIVSTTPARKFLMTWGGGMGGANHEYISSNEHIWIVEDNIQIVDFETGDEMKLYKNFIVMETKINIVKVEYKHIETGELKAVAWFQVNPKNEIKTSDDYNPRSNAELITFEEF